MPSALVEAIGYAGSVLVAISLMMTSLLRLRVINLLGALCFTVYGLLIRAYPVAALNGLIVLVDAYYLAQMLRQKEYFTLLEVPADSAYLHRFLTFHKADIRRFFPAFRLPLPADARAAFILRDMVPAGVFLYGPPQEGTAPIYLDYVIPGYRDFKIGRFLFGEEAERFRAQGIRRFVTPGGTPTHRRYLRRMGFRPAQGAWVRDL